LFELSPAIRYLGQLARDQTTCTKNLADALQACHTVLTLCPLFFSLIAV